MTKLKQAALALATAGLFATQAQAGEAFAQPLQHAPVAAFSQQDIGSLFDQAGQPMQLAALSDVEMRETEGAWGVWGASIGGFGGFAGFAINNRISGHQWSWAGAGAATFQGARAGATAGPVGVVWGFNRNIGVGTATGVFNRLR